MVVITEESLLKWSEYKDHLVLFREKAVKDFINIYNKYKSISDYTFKWGDEIEYSLVKFDHVNKKAYLLLKAEEFFKNLYKVISIMKMCVQIKDLIIFISLKGSFVYNLYLI